MSRSSLFRRTAALSHAAIIMLLALALGVAPVAASSDEPTSLGYVYGSTAFVGSTVVHGRSVLTALDCDSDWAQQSAAEIDGGSYFQLGSVVSTIRGAGDEANRSTVATSRIEDVSVLDGLIRAQAITARSTTTSRFGEFNTSGKGSSLKSLFVAGYYVGGAVEPNTRIGLPGIGHVVLNEQIVTVNAQAAMLRVNMIHVYVTDIGAPVGLGTEIVVASAWSMLSTQSGNLTGNAHGTGASLPGGVSSDPSAPIAHACSGTEGREISNVLAELDLSPILETGEMTNVVMGDVTPDWTVAESASTVQNVELLGGLITVGVLSAEVSMVAMDESVAFEASTSFTDLRIAGILIDSNVPPNTNIPLPGIGNVWLNLQTTADGQKRVRGILVQVTEPNLLGLPIGSRIRVAYASVGMSG